MIAPYPCAAALREALTRPTIDDGVEGRLRARVGGGVLTVTAERMPVERLRIYAPERIITATVNGEVWKLTGSSRGITAEKA